jgi:hypothetical protein
MIEIHVPHGSPMGSKSGIGASTITEVQILNIFVHLRDVGVITWFVFHISNFYKFTQWNYVALAYKLHAVTHSSTKSCTT